MNNFDIIQFDSIDSTNTYGVKNFDKLKDKTAVSALVQTQGKGPVLTEFGFVKPLTIYAFHWC